LVKDAELTKRFDEREMIQNERTSVINKMKIPFIMTLVVILSSVILLPVSNTIHFSFSKFEIYPICFIIVINIISLFLNAKYIFKVITIK
jgi:hypothetical protein